MTELQSEVISVFALSVIFFLILMLGEGVSHFIPDNPEIARKTVHFLSGLTALSFPYLIHSHWLVLLLAGIFLAVVTVGRRKGKLRSVHGIERKSYGALYFPVAVYGIFLLGRNRPVLYLISILVVTISDSLAALLGGRYGSIKFEVEGHMKSLEGSVVFFFVTFLCVHLSLLLMTQIDRLSSVLIALVIALLVTGFEAISLAGSDNIFIPFGTYYILQKMTAQQFAVTVEDLLKLLLIIAVTVLISVRSRLLKVSGLIGVVLLNYAAWSLCDFYWLLPLLLAQTMLYLLSVYFSRRVEEEIAGYQVKVFIYRQLSL
jgi:phytol kinase